MISPMKEARRTSSRHVPIEQLMPPVPTSRAFTLAGMAALLGAVVWGAVAYYGHIETSYLAWGIGVFVGFAAIKAGGHGNLVGLGAGVLTLLSIGTGKQIAFRLSSQQQIDRFVEEHATAAAHAERVKDAADWLALGDDPQPEQVRTFAEQHGFDLTTPAEFAAGIGATLQRFAEQKPSLEQWQEHVRDRLAADLSFADYLRDDFHPFDILFVLLGIASAFGLVSNHTTKLHVAVRAAERKRREAEAAAPPAAE